MSSKLTDEQKERIRRDFREYSGGYHPGEAAEEAEKFLDEWAGEYGEEELDEFLQQWGEEELEKDVKAAEAGAARRKDEFKKRMQGLATSFVKMNDAKTAVIIHIEDPACPDNGVILKLPERGSVTEAKAEAADAMWLVQLLLERGAEEAGK